jgi:uncharacterized protein YegL
VEPDVAKVPRLWAPTAAVYYSPGGPGAHAGAAASPPSLSSFVSFGQWYRQPQLQESATVCLLDRRDRSLALTCGARGWQANKAQLGPGGDLHDLPVEGSFDGTALVLAGKAAPSVWAKLGWWRLDYLRKTMASLAALGLLMSVVAASFHPGLVSECGPTFTERLVSVRAPLKVVFLLDASGSISDTQWEEEKNAAKAIGQAFVDVYASDADKVHIGVAQFASDAQLDLPITSDWSGVSTALGGIPQQSGGTVFGGALNICQQQLNGYTQAGDGAFDLCVLFTDGDSSEDPSTLPPLLAADTKLMGIYVGNSATSAEKLWQLTSCSGGQPSAPCPFFTSAEDFERLRSNAQQLAESITTGLETEFAERLAIYQCDAPVWTLVGLLAVLPALFWWLYLRLPQRSPRPEQTEHVHKDPARLSTVGGLGVTLH